MKTLGGSMLYFTYIQVKKDIKYFRYYFYILIYSYHE